MAIAQPQYGSLIVHSVTVPAGALGNMQHISDAQLGQCHSRIARLQLIEQRFQ
jgi:hypothetical protein